MNKEMTILDKRIEGLVRLIDQALELAQERLNAKRAGHNDVSSVEGLEQIISALQARRDEAVNTGFEISDTDIGLGLARSALEYDVPDSALMNKVGEVERYFTQHFVRR